MIFNNQFKYLEFFRFFWQYNVFLFMILIFTFLSLIYFSLCPSDKAHLERVMSEIRKKNKTNLAKTASQLDRQGGDMTKVKFDKI
jgi:hypothetical protein